MKKFRVLIQIMAAIALVVGMFSMPSAGVQAGTIPTFSISSVIVGTSVTIQTANFPAGRTFTVRIGAYGTYGIGGTVVATTDSGAGGSFSATYAIPAALKTSASLAIRMDATTGGYYAYNWFTNATVTTPPTYTGIPTFSITSVVKDSKVTIQTNNFPAAVNFTVRIGAYGTAGIGGTVVATTASGTGGSFAATYDIPAALAGAERLAIRMDATAGGFYAYNWFWNSPTVTPTPVPGYTGIPTFVITSVVKDSKVTVTTTNLPAGINFTVRMGAYGTAAIGGTVVATTASGTGGTQVLTYTIPAAYAGATRIAIRMDSPTGTYFAYNWFWNSTAP